MIIYASCQDQVSARLAPEYFTIGHPPIPGLSDPTLLGLAWGFLGGFPGGIMLASPWRCSRDLALFRRLRPASLSGRCCMFLAGVAIMTLVAGLSSWYNAEVVNIAIGAPWDTLVPPERHRRFFIVACAHFGTYLGGVILGLGSVWLDSAAALPARSRQAAIEARWTMLAQQLAQPREALAQARTLPEVKAAIEALAPTLRAAYSEHAVFGRHAYSYAAITFAQPIPARPAARRWAGSGPTRSPAMSTRRAGRVQLWKADLDDPYGPRIHARPHARCLDDPGTAHWSPTGRAAAGPGWRLPGHDLALYDAAIDAIEVRPVDH